MNGICKLLGHDVRINRHEDINYGYIESVYCCERCAKELFRILLRFEKWETMSSKNNLRLILDEVFPNENKELYNKTWRN